MPFVHRELDTKSTSDNQVHSKRNLKNLTKHVHQFHSFEFFLDRDFCSLVAVAVEASSTVASTTSKLYFR